MKTIAILPVVSILAFGCAAHKSEPIAQAPMSLKTAHVIPMTFDTIDDEENPYIAQSTDMRSVGDWVTTEFAANGYGHPLTIQQRVLSKDGATSIVEVAIKDGAKTQTFRLRSETTRAGEQVLDVTKVDGGIEHATTLATYEAAMQRTVPSVDRNDGMLDCEPVTLDIGGRKVDAVRTSYKVMIGGKPATMSVVHSDSFAWGDLAGDIVSATGKTLYSTRVTDTGTAAKNVAERE